MDVVQRRGDLGDVAKGYRLEKGAPHLDHLRKALSLHILHDVIDRAVLLEDVSDTHDAGMAEAGENLRLFDELLAVAPNHVALSERGDNTRGISRALVVQEKLLDGDMCLQEDLLGKVCDAEAATAQHLEDGELATLKHRPFVQRVFSHKLYKTIRLQYSQ